MIAERSGCLIHVAAGDSTHGGVQAASALFTRALRQYAGLRDLRYTEIELRNASRWEKVRVAVRTVLTERSYRGAALFFDHVGPARIQPFIPAPHRRPYAVFLHGIEVWRPLRASAATALRQAALLLSNSDHTQRRAREFVPDLPAVSVVGLALPDDRPQGLADEELLGRAASDYFLLVGRMHPAERYKGHDLVLEALAGLRRHGLAERCVFVGDGADRPRIEKRANELGVRHLVLFAGAVSDATLDALYARCCALVLPSIGEGFGLVYLEAMRAGRPCVAARGGAPEEIVIHGVTGFLVDPCDPRELQDRLALLARDAAAAGALGAAGRKRWLAEYTEGRFQERLYPELDRLFERGSQ